MTNPQEILHEIGSLRVENTRKRDAQKLWVQIPAEPYVVNIGSNLNLGNGTLEGTGSNKYFVDSENFTTTSSGHKFNNVDLDLNGANQDIVV